MDYAGCPSKHLPPRRATVATLFICIPMLASAQTETPSTAAQARIDAALAVTKIDIRSDAGTQNNRVRVAVQVKNNSAKPIYAFGISVTARYADGSTKSHLNNALDLIGLYFDRSLVPPGTPETYLQQLLRPEETFTAAGFSFPTDRFNAPPIMAEAAITMIIFEDNTAIGDHRSISRLTSGRELRVDSARQVTADLRHVLEARDPVAAAEEIKRQIQDPHSYRAGTLDSTMRWARGNMRLIAKRLAEEESYIKMLEAHLHVEEVD